MPDNDSYVYWLCILCYIYSAVYLDCVCTLYIIQLPTFTFNYFSHICLHWVKTINLSLVTQKRHCAAGIMSWPMPIVFFILICFAKKNHKLYYQHTTANIRVKFNNLAIGGSPHLTFEPIIVFIIWNWVHSIIFGILLIISV